MLLAVWMAKMYDITGVFLKGNFGDGEEMFIEVLQGMEYNY